MGHRWEDALPLELARKMDKETRSRILTPDQLAHRVEKNQKANRKFGPHMDRRGFVLQSLTAGGGAMAATMLCQGCAGGNSGPADGTYELPYTREEPGATTPDLHFPIAYGGQVDGTNMRVWVEVLNPNVTPVQYHPQEQAHYIKQIQVLDEFDNEIGGGGFNFTNDARYVIQFATPQGVQNINVLSECNLHGWWKTTWKVEDLNKVPTGDLRRPYTASLPGELPTKHAPLFGKRPNGDFSIEIGDRNGDGLHPMENDIHWTDVVLVFDEYGQLRAGTYLDPAYNPEPVYDFDPVGGTQYIRVVASCNLHGWWEAIYNPLG